VIVGGGTAAANAITTIRELDGGESEILLVADERPYSRMVLPYYLGGTIGRSHVFTLGGARLAELGVTTTHLGRRAVSLDAAAGRVTLDDGAVVGYDDLLVATGSSPALPELPGIDGPGVRPFWTLPQADALLAGLRPGCEVALVGAGFIAFTILNALLRRGVRLTLLEIAPRVLPNMVDAVGARIVTGWLERHGVRVRTGAKLEAIEQVDGRRSLALAGGERLAADAVVVATGVRPRLDWLRGSGVAIERGILVDARMRSSLPNVYAAGDVAQALDRVTGERVVHAIEPAAMEHGRIAGANMAGRDRAHAGTLAVNIVDAQGLEVASFGAWNDPDAESVAAEKELPQGYRRLAWRGGGERLTGAIVVGASRDLWATHDVGMLKGLVHAGAPLGAWKERLRRDPWDVRRPFVASGTVARLLPETVLGRPSLPADAVRAS
jgi:NADPH-dependent 2,4-dienoyl-CoA reductase/sulfur reductase-like enzyme